MRRQNTRSQPLQKKKILKFVEVDLLATYLYNFIQFYPFRNMLFYLKELRYQRKGNYYKSFLIL